MVPKVRKVGIYKDKLISGTPRSNPVYRAHWRLYFEDVDGVEVKPAERHRNFHGKELVKTYNDHLRWAEHGVVDKDTGYPWGFVLINGKLEPRALKPVEPEVKTVWELATHWRRRTWIHQAEGTLKQEMYALRTLVAWFVKSRPLDSDAEPDSETGDECLDADAAAYLATVAFRNRVEPTTEAALRSLYPGGTVWRHKKLPGQKKAFWQRVSPEELWRGLQWVRDNSLPVTVLTDDSLADLRVNRYPLERPSSARRWTTLRSVLEFGGRSDYVSKDLQDSAKREQPKAPKNSEVRKDAVPHEKDMWHFADVVATRTHRASRHGPAGTYERWRALPLVLGGAGLRIGEALILRRRHIEEHPSGGMWITVEKTVSHPQKSFRKAAGAGSGPVERKPKARGEEGKKRKTYLPPEESAVLREHLRRFVGPDPEALLFPDINGNPMRLANLAERIWEPALEIAFPAPNRLRKMPRHALRHLFATRCLRHRLPISLVAQWGGWKRTSTLVDVYDTVLPGTDDIGIALLTGGNAPLAPEPDFVEVGESARDDIEDDGSEPVEAKA